MADDLREALPHFVAVRAVEGPPDREDDHQNNDPRSDVVIVGHDDSLYSHLSAQSGSSES